LIQRFLCTSLKDFAYEQELEIVSATGMLRRYRQYLLVFQVFSKLVSSDYPIIKNKLQA
jgi:hypothetical protein